MNFLFKFSGHVYKASRPSIFQICKMGDNKAYLAELIRELMIALFITLLVASDRNLARTRLNKREFID